MTAKEEHKHVWEGKVARHAAARGGVSHFPGQLDSPALLSSRKVTTTPYALPLLPHRRPPKPLSSFPPHPPQP